MYLSVSNFTSIILINFSENVKKLNILKQTIETSDKIC